MLIHLSIQNLAIVSSLSLDFKPGMTVLTGETGAGKSILLEALGLALGERADHQMIRNGSQQAEISAIYDIERLTGVLNWLTENDLEADGECVIRRTINGEGKSRAYINGKGVPIVKLKELGEFLVNIHGQHQHQSLLKPEHQRLLLDEYAGHKSLLQAVKTSYQTWHSLQHQLSLLLKQQGQQDKLALLQYQTQEIEELQLQDQELLSLEQEHRRLNHAEQWLTSLETALRVLEEESQDNALQAVHFALAQVTALLAQAPQLKSAQELLNHAAIQLKEAIQELRDFQETIKIDPERLLEIDHRLSQIHALSRKHRIQPDGILEHYQTLLKSISALTHIETTVSDLKTRILIEEQHYQKSALALRENRMKAAQELKQAIFEQLKNLEMQNGQFEIQFSEKETFSASGMDDIEFLVTTNPGQSPKSLRKVASGGELSRISLAIQVITAQKVTTPTLIFDEVDVGVSGKTAETVGKLLRQLGQETQVLSVTHLPQVAAQGQQHFKVLKHQTEKSTQTEILALERSERIQEIARLLGGSTVTEHALLHAEDMLCS